MARNQLRMRQRASYEPRDLGLEDVSERPPEIPGYQTRQFNVQYHEHQGWNRGALSVTEIGSVLMQGS